MTDQTNDPTPEADRLPYHAPVLRDHGTMREITQTDPAGPPNPADSSAGYGPSDATS